MYGVPENGACRAVLELHWGNVLTNYLQKHGLLVENGYEDKLYCYERHYLRLEPYDAETAKMAYAVGEVGDDYVRMAVPVTELRRWKLDAPNFMAHALSYETLGIKANQKGILGPGCRKLAYIAHLDIHLYYSEHGSESELFAIEQDAGKMDRRVVIITAEEELQGAYAQRYSVGEFQHVPLRSLFDVAADGSIHKTLLTEQLLSVGKAPKTPPYYRYPGKTEGLRWEDVRLSFDHHQVSIRINTRPAKTFNVCDFPAFNRPVNARSILGAKMNFIAAATYVGAWRSLGERSRQTLHRVDESMRLLFGIKEHCYEKTESGLYRFRPEIQIGEDLRCIFNAVEAQKEVEDAFRFEQIAITQNGKRKFVCVPCL